MAEEANTGAKKKTEKAEKAMWGAKVKKPVRGTRCWGELDDPLMRLYHDREWGTPLHDDRKIFEFLVLEGMQAGLSWSLVLKKRENFRKAFKGFDPAKVAKFTDRDVQRLLNDAGIIRNRLKIQAAVTNARAFLAVRQECGTFDKYLWAFVKGRPIFHNLKSFAGMPAKNELSDEISLDLKRRGFKFLGSTVVYANLQATGLVNDHLAHCFRYREIKAQYE
jgi:DNA-3-methyladenine glycosylase I